MRLKTKIASALLGLAALPAIAWAAVIGGTYYAPQYDYREFFAAADGRNFQVILYGTVVVHDRSPWPSRIRASSASSSWARRATSPRLMRLRTVATRQSRTAAISPSDRSYR